MILNDLLKNVECAVFGDENTQITGVKYDSRAVEKGDLFFCISGFKTDGHQYAEAAVEKGAVCLMVTRRLDLSVTQVLVKDDRAAMSLISAAFYGEPARKMCMIGITGTNGKTTTTYMLKNIFEAIGKKVGLIGTIQNMIGDKVLHTERTTPESPDFQALLAEMVKNGVDTVVMEVSSHSLALKRVYGVEFDASVFTNLTQDHLDFHGTFENYAAAKHILAENSKCMAANVDDEYGAYMLENTSAKTLSYGIKNGEMRAEDIEISVRSSVFTLKYKGASVKMEVGIPGRFTVYNAMSAASVCAMLGINLKTVADTLKKMPSVAGRFEALDTKGLPATVILDYAHTPDSLENVLKTARGFAKGRVVCIVGCGGNRDATKRPIMGKIACDNADFTIITSDNPRFEQPMDIIRDILKGIKDMDAKYTVIENRKDAILYALKNCEKDDIILLAGKGHEDYQEICGIKHHFDEKEVVAELLEKLGY